MNICVPTEEASGLESEPYGHFGSATYFVVHDTTTGKTKSLRNPDQHRTHGACHPLETLVGEKIDALIVGGIGRRAVSRLNDAGIKVFRAEQGTVAENVRRLLEGALAELTPEAACSNHGRGCGHEAKA